MVANCAISRQQIEIVDLGLYLTLSATADGVSVFGNLAFSLPVEIPRHPVAHLQSTYLRGPSWQKLASKPPGPPPVSTSYGMRNSGN